MFNIDFISRLFIKQSLHTLLILSLIIIINIIIIPNVQSTSFSYSSDNFYFEKYGNAYLTYSECDKIFVSSSLNSTNGTRNGTFVGPDLVALGSFTEQSLLNISKNETTPTVSTLTTTSTPVTTLLTSTIAEEAPVTKAKIKHARQCIYTFIAGENERVRLAFTKFKLRSEVPDCLEEYIDVYSELEDPGSDLLNSPFGGRYCDRVIPHSRVSLYRTIVFSFYTEIDDAIVGDSIFKGEYEFINAEPFIAGTPIPNEICSFAIYSEQQREGEFMSPTYPGVYPKGTNCYYLFKGMKGQRVKLEFMDFDLFYGGAHCPFDYMKIFDGESDDAPLISTYCGQQRQLMVFSSGTSLFVQFSTKHRIADSQNRGFSGIYEFSEKFVNLGFITNNNNSEHIRGSECDQKILSKHGSNGTVYAPNYPFLYHSNTMCRYYFYGLQDAQNLEKINFEFEMLQIPTKDINECTDAYVRLYTQTQAVDEFDYAFCGETIPPRVVSDGPILMVIFNSGSTQGQGFKARYWFETDFKIPGAQLEPGFCHYQYSSSLGGEKSGEINSPRHPANYPSSTNCVYEFIAEPGERILLVFSHFKVSDQVVAEKGVAGYNDVCQQDWVEIYAGENETLYGRYCGMTAPGPIITEPGVTKMKVFMNTDAAHVSGGFSAHFRFLRPGIDPLIHCGSNYSNLENGVITSPNYPDKYPDKRQLCNWFIIVRPGYKVLLYLEQFLVEGDPAGRGCSAAVVRVWSNPNRNDLKPIELCGDSLANKSKEIISTDNILRLSFFGAQKSVGATGFSAVWTEIALPVEMTGSKSSSNSNQIMNLSSDNNHSQMIIDGICPENIGLKQQKISQFNYDTQTVLQPPQFQCNINKFCISSQLRCNGIANCGFGDDSDEAHCVKQVKLNIIDLVGGLTGLLMLSLFTFGIIVLSLILLITWYRRIVGCGIKQVPESNDNKNNTCPHLLYNLHHPTSHHSSNGHFSDPISGLVLPYENNFNPLDRSSNISPESQHQMLSLTLGTKTTKQWPVTAAEAAEAAAAAAVAAAAVASSRNKMNNNDVCSRALLDDDDPTISGGIDRTQSPSTDDTPIPPPPPPPHHHHHHHQNHHQNHHHSNHHLHHSVSHHTPIQNSHLVHSRSNNSSLEHSLQFNTIAPEPSIMMMMNVAGSSQSIDRFSSFRPPPIASASTSAFMSNAQGALSTFAFSNTPNMSMFHTLPHQFVQQAQQTHPAHSENLSFPSNDTQHFATLQRYGSKSFHKGSSIDATTNYHVSNVENTPEMLDDDDADLSLRLGTSTSSGISHHLNYKVATAAASSTGNGSSLLGGTFHSSTGRSIQSNNIDELFNNDNGVGTGSSTDENGIDVSILQCTGQENQSLILDE